MSEEFYIGQIFEGVYPAEAAQWCNERGDCYIDEIESIVKEADPEDIVGEDEEGNSIIGTGVVRRFEIKEIPPETEEEKRARLNMLSLTKREVFLALYKAKGLTPDQLKTQITDPEALIEFEYANDYYRGNPLINQIGAMLGYSGDDLDYLFVNKELPPKAESEE